MQNLRAEPIKILHVLGSLDPGGVETWLLQVLKNVDRDRFHFDFCTFGSDGGVYAPEVKRLGARIVPCPRKPNLWSFRRRFVRVLCNGKYDAVHSHVYFFSGAVLRWANAAQVPIRIAHSHNSDDEKRRVRFRRVYVNRMRAWIRQYATHGLAPSGAAAVALFGENWKEDARFRVFRYGLDLEGFEGPVDREKVRKELGIPVSAFVVGHVGRFVEVKNHQLFLQIADNLASAPDIHFLFIGDGPLRPEIQAAANSTGLGDRIHFAGVRTDVSRILRGAMDAFVFPSLDEGFGIAVLEAQVAGLPCVVSDAVPRETVISPESVEFIELRSGSRYWADQIFQLYATRQREPILTLDNTVRKRVSIRQSVDELANIYSPPNAAHGNRGTR